MSKIKETPLMKLISEERYNKEYFNIYAQISTTLQEVDTKLFSVEFFVSDTFLVIKIYKKEA